ncbi:MAG: hypothetical protein WC346_00755 [Methanogenium sp.]
MNMKIAAICVAFVLCICCLCCGCMDAEEKETDISLVVVTAEPTLVADMTYLNGGWLVCLEESVPIGGLEGFESFKPNKNGKLFQNLRVEVKSDGLLTLLFLTPDELMKFENKTMRAAGNYNLVARYDDVTSGTYTQIGSEDLTIALINEEKRPVTAKVSIWYHT